MSYHHPGAIAVNDAYYLPDAKGKLTPIDDIPPAELLEDELVKKLVGYAEELSGDLARFLLHSYADIGDFDALLHQEYNVVPPEGGRGNRTFRTYDGLLSVELRQADRIVFGPTLQVAKTILDEIIRESSAGASKVLVSLVNEAFAVDKEGKVDFAAILSLRRHKLDHPRWPEVVQAISDSIRVIGSKEYLRFYRRPARKQKPALVPLALSAVQPTPEALDRRSLRRSVEEGRAAAELAATYLLDGAPISALRCLDEALRALGGEGISDAEMKAWQERFAPRPTPATAA
jgi:hypothetical protein